jgi:hypothetical protein
MPGCGWGIFAYLYGSRIGVNFRQRWGMLSLRLRGYGREDKGLRWRETHTSLCEVWGTRMVPGTRGRSGREDGAGMRKARLQGADGPESPVSC